MTATGRPEEVAKIAGTIQVIPQERIAHSSAKSVTDLLAENSVGFMSEWTAGQTSINIRGAATDGQGRDFKSQVLVLINGHRAGTANVSKLSPADVERIEIVRGPSSVVYGSQNMGGVINIILKTGRTAPGTLLEASTGSWLLFQGKAQTGGTSGKYDWYVGTEARLARRLQSRRQRHRAEHPLDPLRRHRRVRAADRRRPARQSHDPQRRHLQRRLPRLGQQRVRLRQPLQPVDRPHLQRQDARRARQPDVPGLLRSRRRRSQPAGPAQRRQCLRRAHLCRPQPAPARYRRHPLPAGLQAVVDQRAAARHRLRAQHRSGPTAIA